jgi:hypothetical protein
MARPKGSKNKPKPGSGKKKAEMGLQNTDMILPGNLGNVVMGNGEVREIEKVFKGNDGTVTMTIGAKKPVIDVSPNSTPLPSNWNEMGKVAKLEWLTANPRK